MTTHAVDFKLAVKNIILCLRTVLKLPTEMKINKLTDFFSLGLDSQGIMAFLGSLGGSWDKRCKSLKWRDIYNNPTAFDLANYVDRKPSQMAGARSIAQLVEKYSKFPKHVSGDGKPKEGKYHVAVTGPTGALGAYIVSQLVADERVQKVYCFVRKPAESRSTAEARMKTALILYGGPSTDIGKVMEKVEAYFTDLAFKGLRLEPDILKKVQENVNVVIHSAWAVNYNMQLSSFEHLIKGTHNLIHLCLQSKHATPAAFNFISSIAVSSGDELPETHVGPPSPTAMGYGQSKYVAEQLCKMASSAMTARVLRLGQLVGDTVHGRWNIAESVPVVAKFSAFSHSFPEPSKDEAVFWLPVDVAAKLCVHLALLPREDAENDVFNISNPKSISWNKDFFPALQAAGLDIKPVPPQRWFAQFHQWDHALGGYIGSKYAIDDMEDTTLNVITTKTERLYPGLGSTVVDERMVKLFVEFWKGSGNWEVYAPSGTRLILK